MFSDIEIGETSFEEFSSSITTVEAIAEKVDVAEVEAEDFYVFFLKMV